MIEIDIENGNQNKQKTYTGVVGKWVFLAIAIAVVVVKVIMMKSVLCGLIITWLHITMIVKSDVRNVQAVRIKNIS